MVACRADVQASQDARSVWGLIGEVCHLGRLNCRTSALTEQEGENGQSGNTHWVNTSIPGGRVFSVGVGVMLGALRQCSVSHG
jgi:hypothetical protein